MVKPHLLFAFIFLLFTACEKSSSDPEPTGPVTRQELQSLPAITLEQLNKAYQFVTQQNPTLLQDSVALSRAVFNRLKTNPNGRLQAVTQLTCQTSVFTKVTQLNLEELVLLFSNMTSLLDFDDAVDAAQSRAAEEFPCDSDVGFRDGKADAVRHAFWNALMVKHIGLEFAEQYGIAHEHGCSEFDNIMDLHNNKVGRDVAVEFPTATDEQLLELIIQKRFVFVKQGTPYPPETEKSLVYFKARRPFDGSLVGTMTNPDAGITWNVTFDLNQCNDVIRGQYSITSNGKLQKRRFVGMLQSDGSVLLDVADPYQFEDPENRGYCSAVTVLLTGNETNLSGDWISNNCPLGGEILLKR